METIYENDMITEETQEVMQEQGFFARNKSEVITGVIAATIGAAIGAVSTYLVQKRNFDKFVETTNAALDKLYQATQDGFKINGEDMNHIDLLLEQLDKVMEADLKPQHAEIALVLTKKAMKVSELVINEQHTVRFPKN